MALKSLYLLFPIISILVISISHEGSVALGRKVVRRNIVGGWNPINPRDPEVVEIAKFAITEHNKQSRGVVVYSYYNHSRGYNNLLKYVSVRKAESQVVAGINYRVVISAKNGTAYATKPQNYQAVVWDKPWENFRNLTSFKKV